LQVFSIPEFPDHVFLHNGSGEHKSSFDILCYLLLLFFEKIKSSSVNGNGYLYLLMFPCQSFRWWKKIQNPVTGATHGFAADKQTYHPYLMAFYFPYWETDEIKSFVEKGSGGMVVWI